MTSRFSSKKLIKIQGDQKMFALFSFLDTKLNLGTSTMFYTSQFTTMIKHRNSKKKYPMAQVSIFFGEFENEKKEGKWNLTTDSGI